MLALLKGHRDDRAVIATADDDVLYPPWWCSGLLTQGVPGVL
jgi:hypothetical protein